MVKFWSWSVSGDKDYAFPDEIRHFSRGFLRVCRWGCWGKFAVLWEPLGSNVWKASPSWGPAAEVSAHGSEVGAVFVRLGHSAVNLWPPCGHRAPVFWLCTDKFAPLPLTQPQMAVATFRMAVILQIQLLWHR